MRATIVNDGRRIGLILLDEYIAVRRTGRQRRRLHERASMPSATRPRRRRSRMHRADARSADGNVVDLAVGRRTHLSAGGQQALGTLASQRAANNPF
jgi:hypothetical protein